MVSTFFTLRRIAIAAFGPSLLFGLGEGAILPVITSAVPTSTCLEPKGGMLGDEIDSVRTRNVCVRSDGDWREPDTSRRN